MAYAPIQGGDWFRQLNNNFEVLEAAELIELASEEETITGTDDTKGVTPAGLAAVTAGSARAGLVELATDAEAQAMADDTRALTPANLAAITAGSASSGLVELATDTEAQAGTDTERAVTPSGLFTSIQGLHMLSFVGSGSSGSCAMTGAGLGDTVLSITGSSGSAMAGDQSSLFESEISVADQIQQTSGSSLSDYTYLALLYSRGSAGG